MQRGGVRCNPWRLVSRPNATVPTGIGFTTPKLLGGAPTHNALTAHQCSASVTTHPHPGAVGVMALDDRGRVAVVRQYRHPVGFRLIEPPAGLLDHPGEDYFEAAKRELGSARAAAGVVLLQCAIAWVMAFLVHIVGTLLGFV